MGCITGSARAIAVAAALAVGLAGAFPSALGHAHAHADQAAHAAAAHDAAAQIAAADGPSPGPESPADHGRRHAGGGCHGAVCWSLLAQPVVLIAALRPSLARPTSGIGPLPNGPDLQGDPPVPKHG